ncbi:MAG: acetyl-CoA C-acetyltransferase [Actinobacteria bacterium]|nr:acetyl-CoA C-acetyltransferase [Actinomycetota bacterium]
MNNAYVTDAVRTPIANFEGALKDKSAIELGTLLTEKIIKRNNLEGKLLSGLIMGNVLSAGLGQNPARQCALKAGLDLSTPAFTVNKVCGSSLKAIDIAFKDIRGGFGDIYIAGGTESMSNAPYLLNGARRGYKLGDAKIIDEIIKDGLTCPINNLHMGTLTDSMAQEFQISRESQDDFAAMSNAKAIKAIDSGRFDDEIITVDLVGRKGNVSEFKVDEHPRRDASSGSLGKLKPAFSQNGTITAGNSSSINDGAAALLISSGKYINEYNLKPLAEIIAVSEAGVDPKYFGIAPVEAVKKVLDMAGLTLKEIELIELNEAFAAQSLAVINKLKLDTDIVNVNGGAIALGHPIGASGARITATLLHEMIKRDLTYGMASLCIGSGEAMAIILRRVK